MATGSQITGTVTDASGNGLGGICVYVYSWRSQYNNTGFAVTSSGTSPGSYTISGLPAATYQVEFQPNCGASGNYATQWYDGTSSGAPSQSSAGPVTLTSGATASNIDATMAASSAAGAISGTVTDSSGNALGGICATAFLGYHYAGSAITSSGTYTIPGLEPGT
ncbi:MAG: carboxypeptidase-like regulatory domain-containing protein, partial [Actinobacteria bacterium]|nr:carboxypeptidase-like regulatory domain-containing protein [Actinomycetota bacterium]